MRYYAHIAADGRKQTVLEHLENVAKLSAAFSVDFLKPFANTIGMAHDIGKYAPNFQDRLKGSTIRYEHSLGGAIVLHNMADKESKKIVAPMLEYCIAGHHAGLPDGGSEADNEEDATLQGRLKRAGNYVGSGNYDAYQRELQLVFPDTAQLVAELLRTGSTGEMIETYAFFTRYLFSCLTDADFLDTERFCLPETDRSLHSDFAAADQALSQVLGAFQADTPLKKARADLQQQAFRNAKSAAGISILNMPTGSGKTLCSLKIALQKLNASESRKKRMIYVIPYTSIIEQTAEIFQHILGTKVDVLQHHANYCFDTACTESATAEKLKKSVENWDAPLIITTSVQFFQSLYHYRSTGLRKLHNMGDAVIIFDEIHLLPIPMLQPCLRGIGYLTKYLGSEAIFLSATMPDYTKLFHAYLPGCATTELITDKSAFRHFQKCRYQNLGKTDLDSIVEQAASYQSSLVLVNSRKSARTIYRMLSGNKYHLSTYMTPFDRSETIRSIREALDAGVQVTVVSTSLIEAGVDLDFVAVFRQLAGLDNILQSGGRCNREGKRKQGDVYIFETEELPRGEMQIRANITKSLLQEFEDISSAECIQVYYDRLFTVSQERIAENAISSDVKSIASIPFRSYAEQFEFIKDDTIGVVIDNCEETKALAQQLKYGNYSVKKRLQKYTVALKVHTEFEEALSKGIVDDFGTGVYFLTNLSYYSKETGLNLEQTEDIIF